jgi:hypothetical protein
MAALSKWNGGVILISHDERFITTVANEVSRSLFGAQSFCSTNIALGVWGRHGHQVHGRCASLQGTI